MRRYYEITMRVETPIFIGSGDEAGKKEVALDGKNNLFLIIDPLKLFAMARSKGKQQALEDYYLGASELDIGQWMRKNGISNEERESLLSYSIHKGEKEFSWNNPGVRRAKAVNLQLFIKDSHHRPYLPGSSIKGAIRTALLGAEILASTPERQKALKLMGRASKIEREFFEKSLTPATEKQKIFRGLQLSDSEPLASDSLIGLQQVSFKQRRSREESYAKLPIYREYLQPETEFVFRMTIDDAIFPYSLEDIIKMIQRNNQYIDDQLRKNFIEEPLRFDRYLRLGGGVGYISKTVTHQLYKNNTQEIRRVARARGRRDRFFPSQWRGVRFQGKVVEAGIASFQKIEELKG